MDKKIINESVGAVSTAFLDWVLQHYHETHPETGRKFPYIKPIKYLPPVDDWIVAAVPSVLYAVGSVTGNEILEETGFGGMLYGLGMFLHHTLLWTITRRRSFE